MADRPEFQLKQYALASHLRDPDGSPPPDGIEDRRLAIYRRLFHNNLVNLLGSTFPIVRELYGDAGWRALVRTFMIEHKAHTPYFPRVPGEFLEYLQANPPARLSEWPFLLELAHYEWIELAVSVREDVEIQNVDSEGDLLAGIPQISPYVEILEYRFPVHRISPTFLPTEAPENPTCLVVHRKPDDSIGFHEVSPIAADLLRRVATNTSLTGQQLLEQLAQDAGVGDPGTFIRHGLDALTEMRGQHIVSGTRSAS